MKMVQLRKIYSSSAEAVERGILTSSSVRSLLILFSSFLMCHRALVTLAELGPSPNKLFSILNTD
jgi:hypothetical protein